MLLFGDEVTERGGGFVREALQAHLPVPLHKFAVGALEVGVGALGIKPAAHSIHQFEANVYAACAKS